MDNVIPNLVAYHSILIIKNIIETKMNERKKELEKAEREGRKVTFADGLEEEKKGILTEEEIMKKRIDVKLN
jgi:hypothetical protein